MQETAVEAATASRLSPERCRSLLNEAEAGHLALSRGALPVVLPVTCALAAGSLLVRAGPGSLDRLSAQPGVVAFATTILGTGGTSRCEVLVQGRAEIVQFASAEIPPRLNLINSSLTTVLRVTPELLTGWQFGLVF
jgi:nitroimidazol reductase NimA-like FMN-containing flavoprotein (pyridoxamine 5'-phosphate oxidase superfamily)